MSPTVPPSSFGAEGAHSGRTIHARPGEPEGIPACGQFAATTHPETDVALTGHGPKRTGPAGIGFDDAETNARFVSALDSILRGRKGRYVVENDDFELEYGTAASIYPLPLGSEDYCWQITRDEHGAVKVILQGETDPLAEKVLSDTELAHCRTPEDAAELVAGAMDEVLDAGQGSGGGTPDGFASDAEYWKWRQR